MSDDVAAVNLALLEEQWPIGYLTWPLFTTFNMDIIIQTLHKIGHWV